eukprot:CAMPEP_0167742586 /NCGR_PEP_ID=MMETSP0110_2-20121227/1517_1 /TAXON_ID=629695 /ORGANISM="Gymnochlora sp., Strain CCMP2014" /LENGTH=119 /DNA_ID=CAMNT_0007626811 /DNA_START=1044 /DNA_END=1403 /DNA_ORIENTATION=-
MSKVLGVLVPWTIALFLYMSEAFGDFLVWTSLLVLGFTNYTLPLCIAARAIGGSKYEPDGSWEWTKIKNELVKIWSNPSGKQALILNAGITILLLFVIFMNLRKAILGSEPQTAYHHPD